MTSILSVILLLFGTNTTEGSKPQALPAFLGNYKSWKEATNGPSRVPIKLWFLCRPSTEAEAETR